MIKKRSQVTIFFIMVFVIGLAFFFVVQLGKEDSKTSKPETERILSSDDANIRNFVESCVSITGKEALFYLGFVGGNLEPDPFELYFSFDENYKVPYFYFENRNNIPVPYNEAFWENLLDQYVNKNLELCINKFESFSGVQIDHGQTISDTAFTDDTVIFNVNFPVIITRDSQANNLDPKYIDEFEVRLRDILQTTTTIVEKEVKNDKYIHWDFLTTVSENNYNITAYTEEDNTIVYRIIDLQNKIDDEVYVFQFANKIGVI